MIMNQSELIKNIEWLNNQDGINLISDDGGKWVVSDGGFQPVPP